MSIAQSLGPEHIDRCPRWITFTQITGRSFGDSQDTVGIDCNSEAGQFFRVHYGRFRRIIRRHHELYLLGLQGLEELNETRHRCLPTPQHAIHIDDEIFDTGWDLTAHESNLYQYS